MESFPKSDGEGDAINRSLGPGAEIHGYKLISKLGAGGFGETWLAENLDGEHLALKFPLSLDFKALESLQREVSLYRQLREAMRETGERPPIVALKQSLIGVHPPMLVMEYLAGGDLRAFRKNRGFAPLSFEESLPIVCDILEALAFAHRQNIVHRDLSPENVLFNPIDNRWKLTDFGLGRVRVENELSIFRSGQSKQLSGGVAGKLPYMAPEQQHGDGNVGPAADVYALGVVWSELLLDSERPGLPATWARKVPQEAFPLLEQCLEEKTEKRPSSQDLRQHIKLFDKPKTEGNFQKRFLSLAMDTETSTPRYELNVSPSLEKISNENSQYSHPYQPLASNSINKTSQEPCRSSGVHAFYDELLQQDTNENSSEPRQINPNYVRFHRTRDKVSQNVRDNILNETFAWSNQVAPDVANKALQNTESTLTDVQTIGFILILYYIIVGILSGILGMLLGILRDPMYPSGVIYNTLIGVQTGALLASWPVSIILLGWIGFKGEIIGFIIGIPFGAIIGTYIGLGYWWGALLGWLIVGALKGTTLEKVINIGCFLGIPYGATLGLITGWLNGDLVIGSIMGAWIGWLIFVSFICCVEKA